MRPSKLLCDMLTGDDICSHISLYTPPALVRRTHHGWSRKYLEFVDMGYGYHGSYRGAETVQSPRSYGPLKRFVRYEDR